MFLRPLLTVALLSHFLAAAFALPANKAITYGIHQIPGDSNTTLLFTYRLDLKPVGQDKNAVMWRITKVTITEVGSGASWHDEIPAGEISDWKIEHADASSVQVGEFIDPPLIERTAASADGQIASYLLSGRSPSTFFVVPHFWWRLKIENEQQPRTEGTDKPVLVMGFVDTF